MKRRCFLPLAWCQVHGRIARIASLLWIQFRCDKFLFICRSFVSMICLPRVHSISFPFCPYVTFSSIIVNGNGSRAFSDTFALFIVMLEWLYSNVASVTKIFWRFVGVRLAKHKIHLFWCFCCTGTDFRVLLLWLYKKKRTCSGNTEMSQMSIHTHFDASWQKYAASLP